MAHRPRDLDKEQFWRRALARADRRACPAATQLASASPGVRNPTVPETARIARTLHTTGPPARSRRRYCAIGRINRYLTRMPSPVRALL